MGKSQECNSEEKLRRKERRRILSFREWECWNGERRLQFFTWLLGGAVMRGAPPPRDGAREFIS